MASESTQNPSHRTFSIFIPFLFGLDPIQPESDPSPNQVRVERVVLINPSTQGMVVIEGAGLNLNGMFEKEGPPPAAKSAIEGLPRVEIGEGVDGECAICLDDWVQGSVVKEMPCKHRFHGGCIEKWLAMHGSCPVCRYAMPTEEKEEKKGEERDNGEEGEQDEERGETRREIWVSFSFGTTRRTEEERQSAGDGPGSGSGSDPGCESGANGSDAGQGQVQGEECGEVNGLELGDESGCSMEDID